MLAPVHVHAPANVSKLLVFPLAQAHRAMNDLGRRKYHSATRVPMLQNAMLRSRVYSNSAQLGCAAPAVTRKSFSARNSTCSGMPATAQQSEQSRTDEAPQQPPRNLSPNALAPVLVRLVPVNATSCGLGSRTATRGGSVTASPALKFHRAPTPCLKLAASRTEVCCGLTSDMET